MDFEIDGATHRVLVEMIPTGGPRTKLILTIPEGADDRGILMALARYHPDADPEAAHAREAQERAKIFESSIDELMHRYEHCGTLPGDRGTRDGILRELGERKISKAERMKIARWMIARFRISKNAPDRWCIGDQLRILASPELGEEIRELITNPAYAEGRLSLC